VAVVVVVAATVVVVVAATVVVVVAATVVVVVAATVVVGVARVVVVAATVVVGAHGSVADGTNTKPPNNTNGATTTDIRPAEARTQRVTITPAINKNKPATTTNIELPVSGNRHTSTANITELSQIIRQHNLSLGD
jgi:hypothetical protein